MKHGSISTHQSPYNSPKKLWPPCFWMRMEYYSLKTLKRVNHNWHILCIITGSFEKRNRRKTPAFEEGKILYHHDNPPPYSSLVVQEKLHKIGFKLVPQPPYSIGPYQLLMSFFYPDEMAHR